VSRGRRFGPVARVLGPSVAAAAALVFVYFVAPLDQRWSGRSGLLFGLGLVAVGTLVAWQTWAIARSPYPRLQAAVVLAFSFAPLILLFASAYVVLARGPGAFSQSLTRVDALYFSVTVFATVGFGDIVARAAEARLVVTGQMLCDLLYVGLVVRSIVAAAQIALRNNAAATPVDPSVTPPVREPGRRRPAP